MDPRGNRRGIIRHRNQCRGHSDRRGNPGTGHIPDAGSINGNGHIPGTGSINGTGHIHNAGTFSGTVRRYGTGGDSTGAQAGRQP